MKLLRFLVVSQTKGKSFMQNLVVEKMKENILNVQPEHDDDAMLMLKIAEGSEHALRMIIERWKNPLANYFYRSISDIHTAEDLAQQTFINLYRAKESYTPSAKFSTYLFHIARNVLINEYRKRQRRPFDPVDPVEITSSVEGRTELTTNELEEVFYYTLEKLPENQRTAILLFKQQDMSYEEIAEAMNATIPAVKTWIFRARSVLKDALKDTKHI